ncbi:MAG: stalk domain-containing protein [Armatimonadota bacterium]|nr:stalk domain-containing protein [Armatimonadota bacterium]
MKTQRTALVMAGCAMALLSWVIGSPVGGPRKLEPRASSWGEQLLRKAHEAFMKGDYARAYELAKKVHDKEGDVYAAWFVGKLDLPPGVRIDPYDDESILQAEREYHKRHGGFPNYAKQRVGVNSTALIVHILFKLGRYEEIEPYAVKILAKDPHANIIKSILDASRRLRREKAGKEPLDHSLLVQLPDGRKVVIDVERGRRERAGALYTPAEDIARLLGLRLDIQGNQAIFWGKGIKANLKMGSDQVQVNGRNFKLPKPPYLKGKELLVPVELLQELAKTILTQGTK